MEMREKMWRVTLEQNWKKEDKWRQSEGDQKRRGQQWDRNVDGGGEYRWGESNEKWEESRKAEKRTRGGSLKWRPATSGWFSWGQALWYSSTHTPMHLDRGWQWLQAAVCLASELWFRRPWTVGRVFDSLIFVGWKISTFFFATFKVFVQPWRQMVILYFPSLFFFLRFYYFYNIFKCFSIDSCPRCNFIMTAPT